MVGIKTVLSSIGANFATAAACVKRAAVKSLLVLAVASVATNSNAYEIPTTPAGSWTASGITTGTIPGSPAASPAETGSYFKTTPSGLRMTITTDGVFPNGSSGAYFQTGAGTSTTGLNPSAAGTNPGVFTTTPVLPTGTNPINFLVSSDQCRLTATALTTCTGLGTIKVQLTDPVGGLVPVVAPKLHVTRLGGTVGAMELATGLQINSAGSTAGIGFAATAAKTVTLAVTGGNEFFGDPNAAGTNLNVNCGATATSSAGCGTVQITGNPATILMNVKSYRTAVAPNAWDNGGDAFFFDMSFDEDFGGAPNTYEGGGVAAGHLITDLRLGSGVTAENLTTANGGADATGILTVSPLAVAAGAAPGDTNDGVSSFPTLTTDLIGGTYTVTPTISGASRAGNACGWIDFNQDGLYTAAEGVCSAFAAAATSAPLTWTLPTALAAGQTYARVRVTYDTNMSTASFNGLFSSGEVEDYQLNIMPVVKVVKALAPVADAGTFNLTINGTAFATAIGNGGTTNFRSVYNTGTPDVTVATDIKTAAISGVILTETAAGATVLTNYATTSACVNAAGTAVTVGGTALAPSITIPQSLTGAAANGRAQTITCTLTNSRKPTITVTKISNGAVGGFTFTGNNGWSSQTITTITSGTGVAGAAQTLTAPATATTITETIPAGYVLASASCTGLGTGGTATPNLATGAIALDAAATAAGSNIACTFTNTKLPTVTLTKISNGAVGGFTFTGNNGWTSQTITTVTAGTGVAGATQTLTAAATATTITETIPVGYVLASVSCTGLGTGGTATPNLATGAVVFDTAATAAGSNIACTFTNTKRPTIALTKISNGGVGGFTFTGTNGWTSQTITTVTSGTGVAGATQTLTAAATATTITETIPVGYVLASVSCTGLGTGGTATPNLATGAVAFDAAATAAGATIACTFTNTKLPTVTLTKISNGGVGGFTFTGNNGWTSQTITTVTSGTGVAGAAQTLTAAATATTITETIPGGYVLTAISCSGLGSGGTATQNLSTGAVVLDIAATAAGSNIACTFTNGVPNYTVVKSVDLAAITAPVTLTYTITVKNTGAAPLTAITTSDALAQGGNARSLTSGPTLASGDTNSNSILETTETWVYTATHLVTQTEIDDGTIFSNAMTVGTAQMASKTSNAATTTITQTPNVQVTKTADKAGPLVVGDVITYSFLVKNTGNVTLSGISVAETAFNGTGGTGAITPAGGATTLLPGATTTFTATYTITQTDVDTL
jgi:uncharacterized repeat protein (TIGR01451 family)